MGSVVLTTVDQPDKGDQGSTRRDETGEMFRL